MRHIEMRITPPSGGTTAGLHFFAPPKQGLLLATAVVFWVALLLTGCNSDPWGMPVRLGMKRSDVHRIAGVPADTFPTTNAETTAVLYFMPGFSLTYDKYDQVTEIGVHRYPHYGEPYTGPIVHGLRITDSLDKIRSTLGDAAVTGQEGETPVEYTWQKPPYRIRIRVYASDDKLVDGKSVKKGQAYHFSVRAGV